MCRSIAEGYRRCPGHGGPAQREQRRIRQRIGRYERAARAATSAEQWDRVEHYVNLLDRDCSAYDALTRPEPPSPPPSRAAEFTPEVAEHFSDDELVAAVGECAGDPKALDAIMARLEERESAEQQAAEREREREDAARRQQQDDRTDPLTNPAQRATRHLTPDQACRESYDSYVLDQWMQAEQDCRGELLNRRGQAAGVDPVALFEGPAHVARAYASEELGQWWQRHGRTTYREWRWQWFGRASDRAAAETSRRQDFGG